MKCKCPIEVVSKGTFHMNAQTITGAVLLCLEQALLQSFTYEVCLIRNARSCICEHNLVHFAMHNPVSISGMLTPEPKRWQSVQVSFAAAVCIAPNYRPLSHGRHSACCNLLGLCREKLLWLPPLWSRFCQNNIAVGRHLKCSFQGYCMAIGHFGVAGLPAVWHLINSPLSCTITASPSSCRNFSCCHIWDPWDAQAYLIIICIQHSCSLHV